MRWVEAMNKLNFDDFLPGSLVVRNSGRIGYTLSCGLTKGRLARVPNQRVACNVPDKGVVLMITIVNEESNVERRKREGLLNDRFNFLALSEHGCGWGEMDRSWKTWSLP